MTTEPSPTLTRDAAELARIWINLAVSHGDANAQAAAVCNRAEPADQARLRSLSKAYESLQWVICRLSDPACQAATETLLHEVREQGWPRAVRLAEVSWCWARAYVPSRLGEALALLSQQHTQAEAHPDLETGLPVIERFWREAALNALYCVSGDYERALAHALRAEALADGANSDLLRIATAHALVLVYLSVGDIEGACAVLPAAIAAQENSSQPAFGLLVNHLLALVVSGRFDDAAQLLEAQPELLDPRRHAQRPAVQALVARVRLAQGQLQQAACLPALRCLPFEHEIHTLAANRIWVTADVLIGLGRADEARCLLHDGLLGFAQQGIRLMPMNATQWHRSLADACETEGDFSAATASLRESQANSFHWLAASMHARLQSLHFAAPGAGTEDLQRRQRLRLQVVDQALAEAQAQARSLGEPKQPSQRDLLAQVTHEVRNPIHGVVWMTSMLMASDLDERQRKYVDQANNSARMALNLCNDVLDLARMEAGRLVLNPEPLDLAVLVAECTQAFKATAEDKGVGVFWHCDPALPARLLADRLRLQQLLMNLLSNATKFTQAGRIDVGVLWLGGAADEGEPTLRLSVTDTGRGVSAARLPQLFREFESTDGAPNGTQEGAGLGLALCRQIVQMMGGEIGVNNRPELGCTFWCQLPLPAA